MATSSYPVVLNANSNSQLAPCRTQKKPFSNSAAAESFASDLQLRNPGNVRQHAYACEECPNWHLSAMDAAAHSTVGSNLSDAAKYQVRSPLGNYTHLAAKIKEAYAHFTKNRGQYRGVASDVAKTVGVEDADVHKIIAFLVEERLYKQVARVSYNKSVQSRPVSKVVSIESLSAEEQELDNMFRQLEARKAELATKKEILIDAKRLKFSMGPDGGSVIIKKEGQMLALNIEDARELARMLPEFLAVA